jgi:ribosomal protein S18 acetylase RimI-like enzyme
VIRPAQLEDAEALARVHVRTWQAAYRHIFPPERLDALEAERRIDGWRRMLVSDMATFLDEVEGVVRGFVGVGASEAHAGIGELFMIYVLPEAWGTGLADDLIERGERELRARGFAEAVLSVLADNPRAERFYERHGWHRTDLYEGEFLGQTVELAHHRKQL